MEESCGGSGGSVGIVIDRCCEGAIVGVDVGFVVVVCAVLFVFVLCCFGAI